MADNPAGDGKKPEPMDVDSPESPPAPRTRKPKRKVPSKDKTALKKKVMMYYTQLTKGCGQSPCTTPSCASNPACQAIPRQGALKMACQLATQDAPLCVEPPVEPLAVAHLEELLIEAGKSNSFTRFTAEIIAGFTNPKRVKRSFQTYAPQTGSSQVADKQHPVSEEIRLPTADCAALDWDELKSVYALIERANKAKAQADKTEPSLFSKLNESIAKFLKSTSQKQSRSKELTPAELRVYCVLVMNPSFEDPDHIDTFRDLCIALRDLRPQTKRILEKWFSMMPYPHYERLVNTGLMYITIKWFTTRVIKDIKPGCQFLEILHKAHELNSRGDFRMFYNDAVNQELNFKQDFLHWKRNLHMGGTDENRFSFCQYPFILDPAAKADLLRFDAHMQKGHAYESSILQSLLNGDRRVPYLVLRVRRGTHLIRDTLTQLQGIDSTDFKLPLKVKFQGEEGIDEGGVQKEFFQLIVRELFDVKFGMFKHEEETRHFWFNKDSFEESEYELVGIMLGLAIYNGVILDLHFPDVVYKKLMGHTNYTLRDLQGYSPRLAKSMQQILDFDGDVEAVLCQNFAIEYQLFGELITVELKPGGKDIPVTNDNREEYVQLYLDWFLGDSVKKQFGHFKNGFDLVTAGEAFQLFRWEELELLACGSKELHFEELEAAARYDDGYTKDSRVIKDFWSVVHEFDQDRKKKLLMFCSGSDRSPIRGLKDLTLTITKNGGDSERLPTAHTCFNHLLLPEYSTREKLKTCLLTAVENAEGFGLK